jgi:AcrR family transcriptional regulator
MPKIIKDEEVFRAVTKVILEQGYAGATTKQIAALANVSEVTLFRKYRSKEQLVILALRALIEETEIEAATEYTGNLAADLTHIVENYLNLANRYGHFMSALLTEIPRFPELTQLLDLPFGIIHGVGELIGRYQAKGLLRREPPLHAVMALIGPLTFSKMLRIARPNLDLAAQDPHIHVQLFLEGHGAHALQTDAGAGVADPVEKQAEEQMAPLQRKPPSSSFETDLACS